MFCSSKFGVDIPGGADFKLYIQQRLQGTDLFIQLVTPAYLDSSFCMVELGAAWVLQIDTHPFVVPPVTFPALDAITGGRQARAITDSTALDEMFHRVTSKAERAPSQDVWRKERGTFKRRVKRRLSSVSERRTVSMREHTAVLARADDLERRARYAEGVRVLAEVFERVGEAYHFVQALDPDRFEDGSVLAMLKQAVKATAETFSKVTGVSCRAVVKWLDEPPVSGRLDEWLVWDFLRSDRRVKRAAVRDVVVNNSDFKAIVELGQPYFLGNDLPATFLKGEYENSHWTEDDVRAGNIAYQSAIVAPIGRFPDNPNDPDDDAGDLVGFLCIDSNTVGAFDEDADVPLALALANGLFPVLHLYRVVSYGDDGDDA